MMEHARIEADFDLVEETPEQAARAISSALDFLRVEADAIGMVDVSDLIGRAGEKAREYCPARKV